MLRGSRIGFGRSNRQNAGVVERILFIRLSALGDILNTLPALGALKRARPEVAIDWLVEDRFADLVAQVHGVERVIAFPRRRLGRPTPGAALALARHLRSLRSERYDIAIDFQGNLKGALQLRACRATRKLGAKPAKEKAHRLYRTVIDLAPDLHRASRALFLIESAGIELEANPRDLPFDRLLLPTFRRDPAIEAAVTQLLGPRDARPLVLLHPGTSKFGAFKRWPVERFVATGRQLAAAGFDVRVIAGPGEEPLAEAIERSSKEVVRYQRGHPGLAGLIEMLRRAALLIAADSGPLHLAAALDIPVVGLFGPKDPALYAPPWKHVRVVTQQPPCAPCSRRRCSAPICMTDLPSDPVGAAALAALQDPSHPRA